MLFLCHLSLLIFFFEDVLPPHIGFVLIPLESLHFCFSVFLSLVADFLDQYRVMIILADSLTEFAFVDYFLFAETVRYLDPTLGI